MGKENSIVLFLGVLTCALSLLDFTGQTFHIKSNIATFLGEENGKLKMEFMS